MHAEILDFLRRARVASGLDGMAGRVVVELGSYDLNGTPRPVFAGAAQYTGVDWRPGPGVDVVALAHDAPVDRADVVVCCQMLEHDPHWERTVAKAAHLVREGGWVFMTWAGPGYTPHELDTAPPVPGDDEPHYGNLSTEQVTEVLAEYLPGATIATEYQRGTLDALLWARVPYTGIR